MNVTALTVALTLLGGGLAALFGGWDMLLRLLLLMMVCDLAAGLLQSLYYGKSRKTKSGKFSAKVLRQGLAKKALILLVVLVSVGVDRLTGLNVVRDLTVMFYALQEMMSVIENCAAMGVPVPAKLREIIGVLQDDEKVYDDTNDKGSKKG